jgi:hypothetical protein
MQVAIRNRPYAYGAVACGTGAPATGGTGAETAIRPGPAAPAAPPEKKKNRAAAMSATPATEPITMPAIAPPLSPLPAGATGTATRFDAGTKGAGVLSGEIGAAVVTVGGGAVVVAVGVVFVAVGVVVVAVELVVADVVVGVVVVDVEVVVVDVVVVVEVVVVDVAVGHDELFCWPETDPMTGPLKPIVALTTYV